MTACTPIYQRNFVFEVPTIRGRLPVAEVARPLVEVQGTAPRRREPAFGVLGHQSQFVDGITDCGAFWGFGWWWSGSGFV